MVLCLHVHYSDDDLLELVFLAAMESFLRNCEELVTDDTYRRLMPAVECAISMFEQYVLRVLLIGVFRLFSDYTAHLLNSYSGDCTLSSFYSILFFANIDWLDATLA